ncbi:esterase/lipase family protein [Cellulomonas xiejunii]|uniref:esterase/lipase family protein n=1 Tax=Cellulomonas xiejunii TaxID=2968083 RepID=UPI001D0E4B04|nr:alpha/beta hydrolase [Cellulomonas xiejunii]MCC2316272.1 alpha/beta hydrolase [Cellulomonas xiejunii]
MATRSSRPTILDAVLVVPGTMGSELRDAEDRVVWGLAPSLAAQRWLGGRTTELHVTEEERAGSTRLRPTRLLRAPAFMPVLRGVEPYTDLLRQLCGRAAAPAAVAEFPYDWRLGIDVSAPRLASAGFAHLERWRTQVRDERLGDPDDVRLTIVAHSMGGLVTLQAARHHGLAEVLRQVVTLGTPYFGAVKAVQTLVAGRGAPLLIPPAAARALARTCPGLYDLLPRYRCVDDGGTLRSLDTADLVALDADGELATESQSRWDRLGLRSEQPLPYELHALVGADQPTAQSVRLASGDATFLPSLLGVDHRGDATVYRGAAAPLGSAAFALPQHHGPLAKTSEARTFVVDKLLGRSSAPPLGTGAVGADIPDVAAPGEVLEVVVTGAEGFGDVAVTSTYLESGGPARWAGHVLGDGRVVFRHEGLPPGLHRVEVRSGGWSPVSDVLLVGA